MSNPSIEIQISIDLQGKEQFLHSFLPIFSRKIVEIPDFWNWILFEAAWFLSSRLLANADRWVGVFSATTFFLPEKVRLSMWSHPSNPCECAWFRILKSVD